MVRRIYRNNGAGEKHAALLIGAATEAETKGKITALLQEQVKRTWDEIVKAKGLKVDSKVAAGLMAKNILALVSIEPGSRHTIANMLSPLTGSFCRTGHHWLANHL